MSLFVDSSQDNGDDDDDDVYIPSQYTENSLSPRRANAWKPKPEVHFTASTNQIAHLSDVFQSLIAINSQAIVTIRSSGITIYSTYNYTINVHVTIDPALFNQYELTCEPKANGGHADGDVDAEEELELRLGIDINLIANCFTSVLNTMKSEKSISCTIIYQGDGHPLVIEFDDTLISEQLEFYTFYIDQDELIENEQLGNSRINYENVILEIMLKSDVLTNLLQDLYQIDTEILFIYCADEVLNFISSGSIGMSKLIFPNEKSIMEKLPINKSYQHIISQFKFSDFYKIFKAVRLSSKCKFIKDADGCFSIQLICKNYQQSGYPGTLLTINMTELDHDQHLIDWILQDEIEHTTMRYTQPHQQEQQYHEMPLTNIPRLAHEPLINSFKRTGDPISTKTTNGTKKSRQQTAPKRKTKSTNVPLFL